MRRYPVGAEAVGGLVSFRVWAPRARSVELILDGRERSLDPTPDGYFEGAVECRAGERYGFKLDGGSAVLPDPASRFQPDGPHGPSEIIDPAAFAWQQRRWSIAPLEHQVIYEMHCGTFTREGTWRAALQHLPRLKELGVSLLEIMPVAEFPGAFGWGYDGVQWFAPYHGYGRPDDFRAFIDAAHALGLGVILDVVYNHFGPDGNYASAFSPAFVSTRYRNEWGDALNFDGEQSAGVRAFARANIRYWAEEFNIDGFRFDAVQQIFDASAEHIAAELTREARDAAGDRTLLIFGEHEPQHATLARDPSHGGYGMDAIWNDDFHHAARVALTGRRAAYFSDYEGRARELAACARHAFLFQGQHYSWQQKERGEPALDLPPIRTVCYLENHDQIANSTSGSRLHQRAASGSMRAMTSLLLLGPWTPLLFQGQEFNSSRPFLYFADHTAPLCEAVAKGRREFMSQFRETLDAPLPAPHDRDTFERSILDDGERRYNTPVFDMHRDLIALRVSDAVISTSSTTIDAVAIDDERLVVRYAGNGAERLLVINLGRTFDLSRVSEPLIAPPVQAPWRVMWHSEKREYGGDGMPPLEPLRWEIPGHAAVLLGDLA